MKRTVFYRLVFAGTALGLSAVATPELAQAPRPPERPSTKSRSLDQQLLEDLDRELLQGLPGGKKPAGKSAPLRAQTKTRETDNRASDSQNPLANIAQEMRSVESRIAKQDTSATTQEEQARIVDELDALLEAAKKARQGAKQAGKKGGSAQAGTGTGEATAGPPRDSTNRIERGTKEQVETADVKDVLRRFWGHLPQRLREEMQASLSEQFLPKYERVIEDYYKRLAEERPTGP